MLTKLPRWVEYGAFCLAGIAGIVNAIGLLGFQHQSVSHLSGTITLLGAGLLSPDSQLIHITFILLSFMVGSAISGYIIQSTALKLGRHYGTALILESILLTAAGITLTRGSISGHYLASAACGLQNAMVTTYSGAVVRTTHMTGIITDLGIMIGAYLRGEHADKRKVSLLLAVVAGFVLGGFVGAYFFHLWQFKALLIPALLAFFAALAYSMTLTLKKRV